METLVFSVFSQHARGAHTRTHVFGSAADLASAMERLPPSYTVLELGETRVRFSAPSETSAQDWRGYYNDAWRRRPSEWDRELRLGHDDALPFAQWVDAVWRRHALPPRAPPALALLPPLPADGDPVRTLREQIGAILREYDAGDVDALLDERDSYNVIVSSVGMEMAATPAKLSATIKAVTAAYAEFDRKRRDKLSLRELREARDAENRDRTRVDAELRAEFEASCRAHRRLCGAIRDFFLARAGRWP